MRVLCCESCEIATRLLDFCNVLCMYMYYFMLVILAVLVVVCVCVCVKLIALKPLFLSNFVLQPQTY